MIKNILICWIVLVSCILLPKTATAQFRYDLPTLCDTTSELIKNLGGEYKEKLVWSGKHINDNSVFSLWINEKTGAWTLLKMTLETSCILGVGDQSNITFGDPS